MNSAINPDDLHIELSEAFGDALQAIGAIVSWAHVRAVREGGERYGAVGIDRCGLLRWIQIDSDLLKLEGKFPGVQIGLFSNDSGGMKHIEISAGKFRLLLSHDSNPQTKVPISDYAKALARVNAPLLFPDPSPPASSIENPIFYAILFHAKSDTKGETPTTLEIRFPTGTDEYATNHLNLFKLFPNLMDEAWLLRASLDFAASVSPREEKIREEALPKFRRASQNGTA